MSETLIDAHEEWPNKRIIGHFMQPHYPFIGEKGRCLTSHAGFEETRRALKEGDGYRDHATVWELVKRGEISKSDAWIAYRENLELVFPHVRRIVEAVTGTVAITSDHGNMLGEWIGPIPMRKYGHPPGLYTRELTAVPWVKIEGEKQRDIFGGDTTDEDDFGDTVEKRLKELGYR